MCLGVKKVVVIIFGFGVFLGWMIKIGEVRIVIFIFLVGIRLGEYFFVGCE